MASCSALHTSVAGIRSHRPAHHLAGKQVQHHGQIQPANARSDVREISSANCHLVPQHTLEGWTTTLPAFAAPALIALYADHATHEQFHSKFKTDLDLERLPSGKFDTRYRVCQWAGLAMNLLSLMGQRGLLGQNAPVRHPAKRRRLKTVIQELNYRVGRLIKRDAS